MESTILGTFVQHLNQIFVLLQHAADKLRIVFSSFFLFYDRLSAKSLSLALRFRVCIFLFLSQRIRCSKAHFSILLDFVFHILLFNFLNMRVIRMIDRRIHFRQINLFLLQVFDSFYLIFVFPDLFFKEMSQSFFRYSSNFVFKALFEVHRDKIKYIKI